MRLGSDEDFEIFKLFIFEEDAHVTAFCQDFASEAPILLFEDARPELEPIHVVRTLGNTYPSIKAFVCRSAGVRNAVTAFGKTSYP